MYLSGKGICLEYNHGEVMVTLRSNEPVFVQSPFANSLRCEEYGSICKPFRNGKYQIFNKNFDNMLSRARSQGLESVIKLKRLCTIYMSFVHGWGLVWGDGKHMKVNATPCWIEVKLSSPLLALEQVISQMSTTPSSSPTLKG